ncbi:S1C family serine protease [Jatrophihabitans sp. YIM 134969]
MSDEWGRPSGVEGGFAERAPDEVPTYTPPPRTAPPPDVAAAYGRHAADDRAFDPPPNHRVAPRAGVITPPVRPGEPETFGAPEGVESFAPAPGDRISPSGPTPESPWWVEGAERDPWRDPGSAYGLGRPAVFVDGRPAPDLTDLDLTDDDDLPAEETDDGEDDRKVVRGRFGWSALALALVIGVVAAVGGGAVGYFLTDRAVGVVTDGGVTLGTAGTPANRPPGSIADLAQRVTPAVVSIEVRTAQALGTGSGVVVSKVGNGSYIVTNNHVVSAAADSNADATIRVSFSDTTTATAVIVGRDPLTDLAVIKVDKTDVTVASLGDSEKVAVGDPVIAIGSPLGLQGSVTSGIISALHRPVRLSGEGSDTDAVIDALQTDAAINPGNSGGALIDASGAIIGINSAIASLGSSGAGGNIGVGFAIPANEARTISQELIRTGKATHSTLGVSARSVTDGTRDGAYIVQVVPDGPAAKAGLKEGDVVTQFGDLSIGSADELTVAVQQLAPGAKAPLTYFRGGSQTTVTVTLGTA